MTSRLNVPQDRAGGFALEKELERRPHKLLGRDLAASEAGGKSDDDGDDLPQADPPGDHPRC